MAALLAAPTAAAQTETPAGAGVIVRLDPRFDALVPAGAAIEKVVDGFVFLEGPVWLSGESRLLYSDLRGNAIYQWTAAEGVSDYAKPFFTGDGTGLARRRAERRSARCARPLARLRLRQPLGRFGSRRTAAGRRSPSVSKASGSTARTISSSRATAPCTSPIRRSAWKAWTTRRCASFRSTASIACRPNGQLDLLTREQERPNGLVLSPDESILYVANSGGAVTGWMAYDLGPSGLSNKRVFFDVTGVQGEGGADGMKVDLAGNVYATGPGGVFVIAPDGTHLGTIRPPEALTNVGWGDDGRTLYITGRTALYRIRLSARGATQ